MFLRRLVSPNIISAVRHASSTSSSLLKISSSDDDQICRILLNNQRQRNILSLEMINQLINAIEVNEKNARVLILTAGDQKVFSSGHSLKELYELSKNKACSQVFDRCTDLMIKSVYKIKRLLRQ